MMSLFSSFDTYFNFFCLLSFILFSFLIFNNFFKMNFFGYLIMEIKMIFSFFLCLKPNSYNKLSLTLIMSVIISLIILNFISVFPFLFPYTSHFGSILLMSLSIWLSFIFFMILKNMEGMILHTIPEGAPIYLSIVLFVIEIISLMIRPITLSVRLVANILAGHLLMILLSKLVFIKLFVFLLYMFLNLVELFVSIIQSYIFCVMVSLYFSEVH